MENMETEQDGIDPQVNSSEAADLGSTPPPGPRKVQQHGPCDDRKSTIALEDLPPLLQPNVEARKRETIGGLCLVAILMFSFLFLTHGVALTWVGGIPPRSTTWLVFFALMYGGTLVGLIGLCGLLLTDPGTIHRSSTNCFPLPTEVQPWAESASQFRASETRDVGTLSPEISVDSPTELYITSSKGDGRVYCVRCLVWRPAGVKTFHCSTCQRCVREYDHHCSVFGRCIAGSGCSGNKMYFRMLLFAGVVGYTTTVIALIWSASAALDPKIVVPVSVVLLWCQFGVCKRGLPQLCLRSRTLLSRIFICCAGKC